MDAKNLGQQIDKISYSLAGVLGVALLALPFVAAVGMNSQTDELHTEIRSLTRKVEDQVEPSVSQRWIGTEVRRQWEPGASPPRRWEWITERRPALLKVNVEVEQIPAVHEPGTVDSITMDRDPETKRPYLAVSGSLGAGNEHVEITDVKLFRRVNEGNFVRVRKFEFTSGESSFQYVDAEANEPGKIYSYRVASVAKLADDAPENVQPPVEREQESDVLGPTEPLPYDFSLQLSVFHPPQNGAPPEYNSTFGYWDYDVAEAGTARERLKDGLVLRERFRIRRVERGKVTVKDLSFRTGGIYEIEIGDDPFSVAPIPELSGGGAETEEEGEEEAEAEPASAEPAPRRPRRSFDQ